MIITSWGFLCYRLRHRHNHHHHDHLYRLHHRNPVYKKKITAVPEKEDDQSMK